MNDFDSPPRRRHHLAEPGEPLVAPVDPVTRAGRLADFGDHAGIAPGLLALSPIGAVPVPITRGGPRALPGLDPAMAWHPLMWLPDRLTTRVVVTEPARPPRLEPDHDWVVRVLFDLTLSGVYDDDGWVDMLALAGLDADRPDHLDRVAAWLDGNPDPNLDGFDSGAVFGDIDDVAWMVNAAADATAATTAATRHLSAVTLVDLIDAAAGRDPVGSCHLVGALAAVAFGGGDDDDDLAERAEIWKIVAATVDDILDPDRLLASMRDDLAGIADRYAGQLPKAS